MQASSRSMSTATALALKEGRPPSPCVFCETTKRLGCASLLGRQALANALKSNKCLLELNLMNNNIGAEGGQAELVSCVMCCAAS